MEAEEHECMMVSHLQALLHKTQENPLKRKDMMLIWENGLHHSIFNITTATCIRDPPSK